VSRRKKPEPALVVAATEGAAFARPPASDPEPPVVIEEALTAPIELLDVVPEAQAVDPEPITEPESEPEPPEPSEQSDDEWPVHRPLIRATLPRPEGQVPERKAPDFTIRQNGRFDGRNGNRPRGQRHAQGQSRFGSSRSGGGGHGQSGHGQRHGNRPGGAPQGGQRGGGRPSGQGRGPGGGGRGPKRGR